MLKSYRKPAVEGAGAVDDPAVGAGGRRHALLAAHAVAVAAVRVPRDAHVDDLHGVRPEGNGSLL